MAWDGLYHNHLKYQGKYHQHTVTNNITPQMLLVWLSKTPSHTGTHYEPSSMQ